MASGSGMERVEMQAGTTVASLAWLVFVAALAWGCSTPSSLPVEPGPRVLKEGKDYRVLATVTARAGPSCPVWLVLENTEDFRDRWRRMRLPGLPPRVNFQREVVVVFRRSGCGGPEIESMGIDDEGRLQITAPTRAAEGWFYPDKYPALSRVFVVAINRSSKEQPAIALAPGTRALPVRVDHTKPTRTKRRSKPSQPMPTESPWSWHGGGMLLGAVSTNGDWAAGGELSAGIYHDHWSRDRTGAVGEVLGLDVRLRGAHGFNGDLADGQRLLFGIAPWLATDMDWLLLQRSPHVYQPTLLGVLLPEAGALIRSDSEVGGYLGWSIPIQIGPRPHTYTWGSSTSYYLCGEFTYWRVAPGFLLLFEPGGPHALFNLGLGVDLH